MPPLDRDFGWLSEQLVVPPRHPEALDMSEPGWFPHDLQLRGHMCPKLRVMCADFLL